MFGNYLLKAIRRGSISPIWISYSTASTKHRKQRVKGVKEKRMLSLKRGPRNYKIKYDEYRTIFEDKVEISYKRFIG